MNIFDSPRWVVFQITEKCNLRCKMCYEWGNNGTYKNKSAFNNLSVEVIEKVFSDLKPYNPQYELFGGEPLLHPQFDKIIELINKYDCDISIPTNGTLLSKYLDQIASSKIKNIWVSIDGPREYNDRQRGIGVYDLALNGLYSLYEKKLINRKGPELGVTMVVTPDNYKTVEEFFLKILNYNYVDKISIEIQLFITKEENEKFKSILSNFFDKTNTNMSDGLVRELSDFADVDVVELCRQVNNVREFYRKLGKKVIGYPKFYNYENISLFYSGKWDRMKEKKNHCGIPLIYAEIGADGFVTPCHTFYEMKLGNIYENSIIDIWKNKEYMLKRQNLAKTIMPICYACSRYFD